MDWVKPEFGEFLCPPRKKQKTENTTPIQTVKSKHLTTRSSGQSDVSLKLNLIGKYCPKTRDELVVNKKKIEEVEFWLKNLEQESTYLLLTGPPGCGKLRTVCVLCKSLGIDVVEWITPSSYAFDPDHVNQFYQNDLQTFEEFVMRASRYPNVISQSAQRVIIVKDIPNTFIRNKVSFHSFLENYFNIEKIRIVFIISEFSVCRDLFPENIKSSFSVKNINFNPVTQRNISSALNNIVKKLDLGKINNAIGTYVDKISADCKGDLRNAIATLQFLLIKGKFESVRLPSTKKKTKNSKTKGNPKSVADSSTISDEKIDIFHGLGRVLYAKKENGKLVHDPQEVADSFISCPQLFLGMLHENYLNTFSTIHDVAKASSNLVVSDLLLDYRSSNLSLIGSGVSVASHGVMTVNSNPIRKFQQFNKARSRENSLIRECKDLLEGSYPLWKGSDILMDISPFVKNISHFQSPHKDLLLKLGKFT